MTDRATGAQDFGLQGAPLATGSTGIDDLPTPAFLQVLGNRVRHWRHERKLSRRKLAEVSGVSERYLAQLEAGQGNMSITLLRKVTRALRIPLGELMAYALTGPGDAPSATAAINAPGNGSIAKNSKTSGAPLPAARTATSTAGNNASQLEEA